MNWSQKRKTKISTIVMSVIIFILGVFVYNTFIKHTPTCSDIIKNQNERGTDCGGVCARMCSFDVKPLLVTWQRPIHISGNVYSVVAYIENQNKTGGIQKLDYEIRVYDEKNILASDPVTGSTFISPNQKTAIIETPIVIGNRKPKTAFITFIQPMMWETVQNTWDETFITSSQETITDKDTLPKLSAVLSNNHPTHDFINIPVVALVYDVSGNLITASQTTVDILPHQGNTMVDFSWQQAFERPVGLVEIIPRVNPFLK